MRQVRIRGNDELLEQYWNYTYDILERYHSACFYTELTCSLGMFFDRTSHEFSRLSLRLKNKDKLESVIKIVEPLLDLVQMVCFILLGIAINFD